MESNLEPPSISSLPVELVLEVIGWATSEDSSVICFAMTCRRFYDLTMFDILEDQKRHLWMMASNRIITFSNNDGEVSWDDCKGLLETNVDLIPESTPPKKPTHMEYIINNVKKDIWCVHRLLQLFKTITTATINLSTYSLQHMSSLRYLNQALVSFTERPGLRLTIVGNPAPLSVISPFEFHVPPVLPSSNTIIRQDSHNQPPALRWFYSIFSFLNPDLRSSTNTNVDQQKPPISLPGLTDNVPLPQPTSTLPSGVIVVRRPIPKYFQNNNVRAPQATCEELTIRTPTIFHPVLYPFTLAVFRSENITKLCIPTTPFRLFDWSQIVPSITLPALTHLAIGRLPIAFQDLLALLQRHPLISVLDLSGNETIGKAALPQQCVLPRLARLEGNAENIIPFLNALDKYKSLTFLSLRLHDHHRDTATHTPSPGESLRLTFHRVFDRLRRVQGRKLSLSIESLDTVMLIPWFINNIYENKIPTISCITNFHIDLAGFTAQVATDVTSDNFLQLVSKQFNWKREEIAASTPEHLLKELIQRFIWSIFPDVQDICSGRLNLVIARRSTP